MQTEGDGERGHSDTPQDSTPGAGREGCAHDHQHPHHVESHPSQTPQGEGVEEGAEGGGGRVEGCACREGETPQSHLESHPPHPEQQPLSLDASGSSLHSFSGVPVEHEDDSVVQERERHRVERVNSGSSGFSSLWRPCEKCHEASRHLSEKSLNVWQLLDSEHCCEKLWSKLLEELKSRYHSKEDSHCLKSTSVLNLIKHILDVPYADELARVKVERFLDAERFFGDFDLAGTRCFFLKNMDELVTKSRTRVGKKLVSWFAGRMSRDEAETKLSTQKKGTYLVRMSETEASSGSFALSVVVADEGDDRVEHFVLQGDPVAAQRSQPRSLCLHFREKVYDSLPALVDVLRRQGLATEDDSPPVRLTSICPGLPLEQVFSGYKK